MPMQSPFRKRIRIHNDNDNNELLLAHQQLLMVKTKNQALLKRTAALARRDQIQKAVITTSNTEIAELESTIEEFKDRFESLASGCLVAVEAPPATETDNSDENSNSNNQGGDEDEGSSEDRSDNETTNVEHHALQAQKEAEDDYEHERHPNATTTTATKLEEQWNAERTKLIGCIEQIKAGQTRMKLKFMETLSKHQWAWQLKRKELQSRIQTLEQEHLPPRFKQSKSTSTSIFSSDSDISSDSTVTTVTEGEGEEPTTATGARTLTHTNNDTRNPFSCSSTTKPIIKHTATIETASSFSSSMPLSSSSMSSSTVDEDVVVANISISSSTVNENFVVTNSVHTAVFYQGRPTAPRNDASIVV